MGKQSSSKQVRSVGGGQRAASARYPLNQYLGDYTYERSVGFSGVYVRVFAVVFVVVFSTDDEGNSTLDLTAASEEGPPQRRSSVDLAADLQFDLEVHALPSGCAC